MFPRLLPHAAAAAALCAALLALPAPGYAQDVEARYRQASAAYRQVNAQPLASPQQWREVAETFQAVVREAGERRRGADALYSAGLALHNAFRAGGTPADLNAAQAAFERFAADFSQHPLADDSLMHLAGIQAKDRQDRAAAAEIYRRIVTQYAQGDQFALARERLAALRVSADLAKGTAEPEAPRRARVVAAPSAAGQPASHQTPEAVRLKRVQVMSALQFTRVIVTLSGQTAYQHERAPGKGDERITLTLPGVQPDDALAPVTLGADGLLRGVRVQPGPNGDAVLTIDTRSLKQHEVREFVLPTETKLVVDLHPAPRPVVAERGPAKRVRRGPAVPIPPDQLAASLKTSLGLKVRSIMLDPGHGGHDPGAGALGLLEKDVALAIATRLRLLLLERHPELRVGMTRDGDQYVALNRRPELAKEFGADLFVSVHLNANPIRKFQGIETYFLNLTSDAGAMAVAARENATTEKRVSDLNGILLDLLRDTNILESSKLASALQSSLVERLREEHAVRDLGVKQAPFMVLIGAEMPSVLVEAGFVTNPEEGERLKDPGYVTHIAEGIYAGLQKYIEDQDIVRERRDAQFVSQAPARPDARRP